MLALGSAGGAETVSSGIVEGFDYPWVSDCCCNDLVCARHDCTPGEAKEVSRGA